MARKPIQSPAPASASEPILVKPSNDIYTVLAAVATVVSIAGLVLFYMRMMELYGGLFTVVK